MDSLKEHIENNKIDIRINSKNEVINLNRMLMKYSVNFNLIGIFLNDSFDSYIQLIQSTLSSDKVSVSQHYLSYFFS